MGYSIKRRWLIGALAGLIVLSACSDTSQPDIAEDIGQVVPVTGGGSYVDIIPSELDSMLEGDDFFFVNVHIPNEGEIPGTEAHIAFDQIAQRLNEFPEDKDAPIVIYCRSGSMSATAARDLVSAGYTNVYNLDGGFRSWTAAGYPFNP
jgi:rhodanese-related sulfurtransferase